MLRLKMRSAGILSLAFSPDGTALAAGCRQGSVQVWDLPAGVRRHDLTAGYEGSTFVGFFAGRLLALQDGRALAFDPLSGRLLDRTRLAGRRPVYLAAVTPAGSRLALGFARSVDCYTPDGEKISSAPGTAHGCLTFSRDGKTFLGGTNFGVATVHKASTGRETHALITDGLATIRAAALSPDGRGAAVCATKSLTLWHGKEKVRETALGRTHFLSAAWHPSGAFFATANGDGKVDYWDGVTGERRESFDWGVGKLNVVVFDVAGDRAACGGESGAIVVWDVDR